MKILFDPQIFYVQKFGGISRYYTEIFSLLREHKDVNTVLPLCYSENAYAVENSLLTENRFMQLLFTSASVLNISTRTLQKKRATALLNKTISSFDFDLFIPTYFDPYFLSFINKKPFVLTVYDMIHELFPEYYVHESLSIVKDKLLLMEKATMIIAVSHNTKKDILQLYPHIDASKIEVIYHGSSIAIDKEAKVQLPAEYILFVGERANYKNFHFLLNAIAELLTSNPHLHLVCAGGGKFKKEELHLFKKMGLEKQIIQQSFKENELGLYYAGAICFVFPSLYEGFGIPVLESMACGCPVLLGHHSSFPEVAGDAGVYVNLNSAEDLKSKIQLMLSNSSVRQEFSKKSLERAKMFTWSHAAAQCFEVYKKAIEISKLQNAH